MPRDSHVTLPPHAGRGVERFPTMLVAGFFGTLVCLFVLGWLADSIREPELSALDAFATPFLHGRSSPALDAIMQFATFLGSDVVLVPLCIAALAWLIWHGRRGEALFLGASVGGSLALNLSMKLFFHRPRPQLPWAHVLPDYSFPSGHSMNSFVLYVALALLAWVINGRRAGLPAVTAAVIIAVTVGVSRIYLGYHYFTDVVGGFAAGALWLLVVAGAIHAGPWLARWRGRGRAAAPGGGGS